MKIATLVGKPHGRFDAGMIASEKHRHGFLICDIECFVGAKFGVALLAATMSLVGFAKYDPSRAENSWTFDENAETSIITDGNWEFKVARGKIKKGSDRYSINGDFQLDDTGMQLELIGTSYVSGSGDTLDFTGPIVGKTSGNAYTLVFVANKGLKNIPAITELYLPKTLGSNAQIANEWSNYSKLKTVVYDSPDVQGNYGISPNFGWGGAMQNVTTFYLNAPKLKKIGQDQKSFAFGTLEDTDVSDWTLTSLTALHTGAPKAFANKLFTGTIRLPAMKSLVAGSFEGCTRLVGAEIGRNVKNDSVEIGASAFAGDTSLAEVTLGGGNCALSIGANAFACAALKKVTLNGGVPVCTDYAPGCYAFGTADTAQDSIVFVVENSAEWFAVLEDPMLVTPWTTAQRSAYEALHPGEPVPYGSAKANVFSTAQPQLVATCKSGGCTLPQLIQTSDRRYGEDGISISCDCEQYDDGTYPLYAKVTVTVAPSVNGHFAEWLDLPYASPDKTNAQRITNCSIRQVPAKIGPARFNHDWTMMPVVQKELENGDLVTISDGVWSLNATVLDKVDRKLKLGTDYKTYAKRLFADGNTATGFLDLTGPISFEGAAWSMTEYYDSVVGDSEKAAITDLYLPETTKNLNVQAWRSMSALTNLVINCPNGGEYLASYGFNENRSLVRLILRVPSVKYLQNYAFNYSGHTDTCRYKLTNVDDWDLSGVEEIGNSVFTVGDSLLKGTLRLPSVRKIGSGAFSGFARGLGGIEFNEGKRASLEISSNAFKNSSSLTNVTFGAKTYETFSIDGAAFNSLAKLKAVVFEGKTLLIDNGLDGLLTAIAASDGDKQVTIFGCPELGWGSVGDRAFVSAEEESVAPSTGYLGVWRKGLRKAWIVKRDSIFKPRAGLLIIFR